MSFANSVNQPNPELLVVNTGYKPPLDLATAGAGKKFTRLHLYGKPANLNHLATLTHLVELRLQSTKMTDLSLLAGMTRLDELIYGAGSLKEFDLAFAAKSLTSLWLGSHRSLTDLAPIGVCRKLKKLSLSNLPRLRSYCDLSNLSNLELLQLRNLRSWPTLTGLKAARSLQTVYLDRTTIADGKWEPLLGLKRLEFVSALEDAFGKEAAAEFRRHRPKVQTPRRFPG